MFTVLLRLVEWALPERPFDHDDPNAPEVRRRLLEQAGHQNDMVALIAPPYAISFAALLWPHADHTGIVVWVVTVVVAATVASLAVRAFHAERPEQPPALATLGMGIHGLAWGALPLLAMPASPAYQALLGMAIFTPLAANIILASSVPRMFWAFHLSILSAAILGHLAYGAEARMETAALFVFSVPFCVIVSVTKMRRDGQTALLAIINERMVAELSTSNEQLAYEVSRDSLTGLSNRADFTVKLGTAMLEAEATGAEVGLLFLDIDHFKVVNDSLGHAAGDDLLVEVARRIQRHIRPTDVLARFGGDEFTVLVPLVSGIDVVNAVAARVLAAFEEPFALSGRLHRTTASVGVACSDGRSTDAGDLLRLADAALYQAKTNGRGRAAVFDNADKARLDRRLDDEAELRAGHNNGEFVGWFQPIVNLGTGAVDFAEGLVRWKRPEGIRVAGEFIDLAAEVGLDLALSKTVLAELQILRTKLRDAGADIELGFNLPPVHLLELLTLFDEQADLSGITIEITETGLIADLDRAAQRLSDMRSRGASIWLDDFGQGQSSMSLLTQLPLDGVKIDKQFVGGMLTDRTSRSIVSAIADIGRNLGYQIIAEGVETAEQASVLRSLGVTHGQGFLFSPAVPPASFLAFGQNDFSYRELLEVSKADAAWFRRMVHERPKT